MTKNDGEKKYGSPLDIKKCWCVPPNTAYVMQGSPCTWPDCFNGTKPDPQES